MRKIVTLFVLTLFTACGLMAQGWPSDYGGVVLQGFFWDSFRPYNGSGNQTMATMYGAGWGENDEWFVPVTNWVELLNQKDNIAPYIDLLWLPQSGATVCSDQSVFTTEGEAWRAGHNGSWVCTRYGDLINNPDCMGFVPVFYLDHNRGETYNVNGTTWNPKSYFGTESELINLISAYKAAGTGAMEDVVANHKGGLSTWNEGVQFAYDFVDEINVIGPTTGKTYSIQWEWDENGKCKDICWDDECGMGSGNTDCGGDAGKGPWARDVDHHNPATQQKIITYLRYLKDELGYIGFRYDYARGFEPKHFAYYNTMVRPTFSVGEFWGTSDDIKSWIKGVYGEGGFQSAAFDFPLQEQIRQAFNDTQGHSFRLLKNDGLIWDYRFRRYAVTFIDNHDTFKDLPTDASNSNYMHRVNNQIVEANCFILAMPGTPCLFYPHFMNPAWHDLIARFVKARRTAGITNESTVWSPEEIGYYSIAWRITGEKGELYLQLGDESVGAGVPDGFTQVWCNDQGTCRLSITSSLAGLVDGNVKQDLVYGYPVIDRNSGNYNAPVAVNVKPSSEGTVLVYTTDGREPNAYSKQITDTAGLNLSFDRTTSLKVGVLANGDVRPNSIVTREYVIDSSADNENIMVYVKYDGGNLPWLYAFDDEGNSFTGSFPGWQYSTSNSVVIGGVTWLHAMVHASRINLILSYGNDVTKTADINGITSDVFLSFNDGVALDLTSTYTQALNNPIVSIDLASGAYDHAISPRITASNSNAVIVYTTDGSEPSPTNGRQLSTYEATVTFDTDGNHVLRAGVLKNGSVINQVARTYFVSGSSKVNIYVSADNDPYIYAWEEISDQPVAPVNWPGTKLTDKNEQGWYHYSQDASSLNIIFNNGNGAQTDAIYGLTPGDYYFTYDGWTGYTRVQTDLPSCATGMGDDVFYCYFENSAHYANPYVWVTNGSSIYSGSSWPGEELGSPVGVAPNGNLIYRWVYNGNHTAMPANVIFSDHGNQSTQTSNMAFVNGGYYNASGLVGVVKNNVMTLADIVSKGEVGKEYVVANDLNSVLLNSQGSWLWVKDDDGDAVNLSYNTQSLPLPDATAEVEYDQSNWAQLILKDPVSSGDDASAIQGHLLLGQTVIGKLTDRDNPTIELWANPIPAAAMPYAPNTFIPANFVEQPEYFMVEPKPQEYVNIKSAVCREQLNDTTFVLVIPKSEGDNNSENLSGAFRAIVKQGYWEDMASYNPQKSIRVNYEYQLTGIVRAVGGVQLLQAAATPDDSGHSPVSDKWELYIVSVTEALAPILRGDVNDDGNVTISDISTLIDYLLENNPQPFNLANADVNGSGNITIGDVTALIDILLGAH